MKNNTPVESIGTWASHADEDVLRPAPNQEGVELGRNDLAAMQLDESVSTKMKNPQGRFLDLTNPVHAYLYGLIRNSRDKVFNITLYKEEAQTIAAILYYEDCISISRKKQFASTMQNWKRPKGMRRISHKKFWTEKQDTFILLHTINESVVALQRSKQSIKMRLWRLRSSNN